MDQSMSSLARWRPCAGMFSLKKATRALPPQVLAAYQPSEQISSAVAHVAHALLKYNLNLSKSTLAAEFCVALMAYYRVDDACPFSVSPRDLRKGLGLDVDPEVVAISESMATKLADVTRASDAASLKAALSELLSGVTDTIALELFPIPNGEASIPALMSLLRLLAKKPASALLPDTAPDTVATLAFGFGELKGAVLWPTVFHFLHSPTIYAQLYQHFAEDFEFFDQPIIKLIAEIDEHILLAPFFDSLMSGRNEDEYEKLFAYCIAYYCGVLDGEDYFVKSYVVSYLPEIDALSACVGRFSRFFSPSFDRVLSESRRIALEMRGLRDGLRRERSELPQEPANARGYQIALGMNKSHLDQDSSPV